VDATNLRLHLRFVLELRRLGLPMVVVLNMSDAAERRGIKIDREALSRNWACRWCKPWRSSATAPHR
jgi:ferrous iron transport protein B